MNCGGDGSQWTLIACALAVLVILRALERRRYTRRLHLVADDLGNESLMVTASIGGLRTLFMIDTAYGGAPVLSTSFLSVQDRCSAGRDVHARARLCLHELRNTVTDDDRSRAIAHHLLQRTSCRSFTSGCTMRLMGIGETSENQSDMLLCPSIRIDGVRDVDPVQADVLVSNPLRGTPHILTMDYLLHRAPCTIHMRRGLLTFYDPAATGFHPLPTSMVGGSFVVPMIVGGASLNIVLDTGASITLSVSSTSLGKMAQCAVDQPAKRILQRGVNGEEVCADMLLADVSVGPLALGTVSVLANDTPVQGSDGYAGMGLLRALDLRFEPDRVSVRRSGLPLRAPRGHSEGTCGRPLPACAAASRQ